MHMRPINQEVFTYRILTVPVRRPMTVKKMGHVTKYQRMGRM